jgi:putative GTP pyrophosphokinase
MDPVVEQYEAIRPQYQTFTSKMHRLLEELIVSSGVDIVTIESRTKTVESFQGKIERDDKDYADPLKEITDLSGVRIITYYNKDVDTICELIAAEFDVDGSNSIDKRKIIEEDRFGYLSSHLVVSLNFNRSTLAEWSHFSMFRCEIQVRSVLQHTWAAIDHKLRYKTKESIPVYLKRKLYRLSALLELADDEFESIRDISGRKAAEIRNDVAVAKLDIAIDRDSVQSYIENSDTFRKFIASLESAGFNKIKDLYTDSDLASLVGTLRNAGCKTLSAVENVLQEELSNGEFYKSLTKRLAAVSPKQKSMSRPAAIRLAVVSNANPSKAKKLLKGIQFKQKLQGVLLQAKS